MKYVEHEERPKALNDLGKKIQLVLKVIEAHRNKVLGYDSMCGCGVIVGVFSSKAAAFQETKHT